jgi:hypothetical protein
MSLAVALYAVVDHIVSKCNDPDCGGRMIDNIITNLRSPSQKLMYGE